MSEATSPKTAGDLLSETKVEVSAASYALISLSHQDWNRLLENPELSPRPDAPFMILRDVHEVTLLLEEEDWQRIRHAARQARVEHGFRMMTFDVELPWNLVGYLARVTEILAGAEISVGALSSFSRDHLLIKQEDLGKALNVLSAHVGELC